MILDILQVCTHTITITDRLTPFIEGLDVPAVVLLMAQRLVSATAAAAVPSAGAALTAAAPPKARSLEDGRLSVGMTLSHLAQRLGQAHVSRRGVFGFGSQQVNALLHSRACYICIVETSHAAVLGDVLVPCM